MQAVSASALSRSFAGVSAVDALTFEVTRGRLFGIVGPDGAGKTTTLRMLAGVLPPTSGDAGVLGVSVAHDPEGVKPHISYMSQRFGLYLDLTVRENILFYADLYHVPAAELPARLERLYDFSRLGEFEHRLAGQLSGGMKQKLSLSCALVHHPAVLLLDEPTFGVDPISRRDLWLILHQMVADGMTVVVTTSYMDEAERCDTVALLHEGRLLALDAPAMIQRRLDGRLFSVCGPDVRDLRDRLRAVEQVRHATLFGDEVHAVTSERTTAEALRNALAEAGAAVGIGRVDASIEPISASMEDAFIELVGGQQPDVGQQRNARQERDHHSEPRDGSGADRSRGSGRQ